MQKYSENAEICKKKKLEKEQMLNIAMPTYMQCRIIEEISVWNSNRHDITEILLKVALNTII